jgi:ferrous iron transport protein B
MVSSPGRAPARLQRIALLGNPNTGKTTLFNALTGLSQRVANYPGVTVERRTGLLRPGVEVLDLPGTYSLAAHTPDEGLAVRILLGEQPGEERPAAVVVIADASNLKRNLYLVTQALELGLPVVVALNMMDAARAAGIRLDVPALARALGAPVVPMVATRGEGLAELRAALDGPLEPPSLQPKWAWPEPLAREFTRFEQSFGGGPLLRRALLDEGGAAEETLIARHGPPLRAALAESRERLREAGLAPEAVEVRLRYAWIEGVLAACVERRPVGRSWTDRLDAVLTHRVWGLLVFAVLLAVMLAGVFQGATPFMEWLQEACGWLGQRTEALLSGTGLAGGALESLLVDGLLAGVGGVLVFLPQIAFLFFFLALLEDGGYLARAAFLMDRVLRPWGLSGQSFIPLVSCFACTVPGLLATRTIARPRDRLATMLVAPLMTCAARLPLYTLMIAAFVPPLRLAGVFSLQALVFMGLYVLGIVTAMLVSLVLKKTLLKEPAPFFALELPPYRMPRPGNVFLRVWSGVRTFLARAGSVIVALSVLVWGLSYFPRSPEVAADFAARRAAAVGQQEGAEREARLAELGRQEAGAYLRQSFFGRTGRAIEPLVRPLGWDWRIALAVLAAFPARELVVSTLQITQGLESGSPAATAQTALITRLRAATWPDGRPLFTLPVALSLLVFFALGCQCAATVVTLGTESGSWRWAAFGFLYLTVLAYLAALATYQLGAVLMG